MAHLTLAGVSDDGLRLLLVSDTGAEHTLDISPSLRAALRGDASRLGQLEIQMDSALRPRDIQARIRAGESPEAVAQAAQTSLDKIMVYAGPVLAERQHVADRAQRSSLRRSPGEAPGQTRTLGDAVDSHLRSCNIDPTAVVWDAWRREDGRWSLTAQFEAGKRPGIAQLTYDAPGNYVVLDNEDARWLVGEAVLSPVTPTPDDDLQQVRRRRLSSVPEDELPLGDDVIEMVRDDEPEPVAVESDLRESATDPAATEESEPGADTSDEPPSRRPVQKKRGRASVPSWDEIMFGGSDQ